ncbi:glycoside hydrolase family 2 TIM barrel-domain containing protein [Chitinophagaceae bacterium 26-R-25]|nr:glycoside hydrolase family 2 TIM barrel-domain containing protein [Chitinophagaceae bacterium 26-R-25]
MKRFLFVILCVTNAFAVKTIAQKTPSQKPVNVEIVKGADGFQLLRNGQPYFVKGAGGSAYPERVAAYGGNSMRTWGSDKGQKVLDSAQKYGLTVLMGLSVTAERHGFSYDDTAAVRKQLEKLRGEVLKYKDHPALLAWGIGNELNLNYKNPKVWNAVNDIAKMIHSLDSNHPVCTVLAGANKDVIGFINTSCPDLDFLGINTYGDLAGLPKAIRNTGWAGAYMVTEWGPTGHWESLSTPWKSAIEETSSEKAAVYKTRYEYSIGRDKEKCLGSYVFLWGQKQERTPTWYGLFTEKGEETEVIDVMQYLWSATWPRNRAPHIYSLQIDGKKSVDYLYLTAGTNHKAAVAAFDPDSDKIIYRWEMLPEPTQLSEGGDFEGRPKPIENFVAGEMNQGNITFTAPAKQGAYRLFIYVSDGKNKVATANFPFYVK